MTVFSDPATIIIDIGTEFSKFGVSYSDQPCFVEESANRGNNFKSPADGSGIINTHDYCNAIAKGFRRINGDTLTNSNPTIIICLKGYESTKTIEKLLHFLFSKSNMGVSVAGILFFNGLICDLFSYGKHSGIVVSLGSSSEIAIIEKGCILAQSQTKISSLQLTFIFYNQFKQTFNDYVEKKFPLLGDTEKTHKALKFARYVKEHAFAAYFQASETMEIEFTLGGVVTVQREFVKNLISDFSQEIATSVKNAVEKIDQNTKNTLLNNIVISGQGSACLPIVDSIAEKLSKYYSANKFKIIHESSVFHTFNGAAVFAGLGQSYSLYITAADYEKNGSRILDIKKPIWNLY